MTMRIASQDQAEGMTCPLCSTLKKEQLSNGGHAKDTCQGKPESSVDTCYLTAGSTALGGVP
jgi:hypothetical protein